MPNYDIYVICDQCGNPHSVNVSLSLDDDTLDKTRLAAHFDDGPLPSVISFMQTNKYRCPHTKLLFPAADLNKAIFFSNQKA